MAEKKVSIPEILYVHHGNTKIRVDSQEVELGEGQIFIYRPMSYHIGSSQGSVIDAYIISFDVATDAIETFYNHPITLSPNLRLRFMNLVRYARSLLQSVRKNAVVEGVKARTSATDCELKRLGNELESFLLDLISAEGADPQIKHQPSEPPCVEAARTYLNQNLHRPLTLAEIAAHAHTSISTLTSHFRSVYGCSVIHYFNTLRIERAQRRLRTGDCSVTEVADALGFSSIHYFSRLYRKHTGHAPSEDCPRK